MSDKDKQVISRIEDEISKIDNKESNIYFFVTSTHGIFDETLDYIYKMALLLKESGYNVSLIHQDEKFEDNNWLYNTEAYKELPLYDIAKGEVNVGVSDVLLIPEVFASVMNQTSKLPCKRIAIIQNITYLTKFMPLSSQIGDFGIMDCLTFDNNEAELIKSMFPYLNIHVAHTYIDDKFYETNELRDMVVNIVSKSENHVNQIAKQFYWKYPLYKWVTFKDMRGLTQEEYLVNLKEAPITIWIDDESNNGLECLEALANENIVVAKIPDVIPEWAKDDKGSLNNSAIWVNSIQEIPLIVSNLVRAVITDNIPNEIKVDADKVRKEFTKQRSMNEINSIINNVFSARKQELSNIITSIKNK